MCGVSLVGGVSTGQAGCFPLGANLKLQSVHTVCHGLLAVSCLPRFVPMSSLQTGSALGAEVRKLVQLGMKTPNDFWVR